MELKKCPHCGVIPKLSVSDTLKNFWVRCYNLKCPQKIVETGYKDTEQGAINAWNRRYNDD